LVLPHTLVFTVFFLVPVAGAVALAFLDYQPVSVTWVGFQNF
jgi:ABC-type polysaccharide transport system permease subunit